MKNYLLITFFFLYAVNSLCQYTFDYTDFANVNQNGWMIVNGSKINQWKIGGADSYYDTFSRVAAYISSDNGTTYGYQNSSFSIVHMYKDIAVTNVTHDMVLSFKLKCYGEENHDYLSVYLLPTSLTPQAGVEIDPQYKIGKSEYSGSDYWRGFKIGISRGSITENYMRVAISWKNDNNGLGNTPAAIDNIGFTELNFQHRVWAAGVNLPSSRYYSGSVSTGYSLFVGGGDVTGGGLATNQFLEYDIPRNNYSDMPPLPEAVRLNQIIKFDSKIFSIGGYNNGSQDPTDKVYSFDLKNFSWTLSGNYPQKIFYNRLAIDSWNALYSFGGSDETNNLTNDVYFLQPGSNIWNSATSMPGDGWADGGVEIINKFILRVGGFTNSRDFPLQIDSVLVGIINPNDPSHITWESRTNFPGGSRARVRIFRWGQNKAIVVGGATSQGFSPIFNDVWMYDIENDIWTQLDDFPMAICAYMAGSVRLTNNVWAAVIAGGITSGPALTNKTTVIFDTLQSVTSIEPERNQLADSYYLSQNYPNPFNPSTKIQFSVPVQSFVTLEIFNTLGERVATLISKDLAAGYYNYDWNAANLPSGIYLYRLKSASFTQSKKMILIK